MKRFVDSTGCSDALSSLVDAVKTWEQVEAPANTPTLNNSVEARAHRPVDNTEASMIDDILRGNHLRRTQAQ